MTKEEIEATQKAELTQTIANDAKRDLDEALPMLDAALASLKSLNRNDVTEVCCCCCFCLGVVVTVVCVGQVRAMQHPPIGVKIVIESVCIMKDVKPKRVAGDKLGVKVDDYWEVGKALLTDPAKFLESLFKYNRDNIPEHVITKIQPYIDNEDFMPAAISKVSRACTSICQWVRAMHKYHFVAKAVAPKRVSGFQLLFLTFNNKDDNIDMFMMMIIIQIVSNYNCNNKNDYITMQMKTLIINDAAVVIILI